MGLLVANAAPFSAFQKFNGPAPTVNVDLSKPQLRHIHPAAAINLPASINLPANWFDHGPARNPLQDFFARQGHPLNQ